MRCSTSTALCLDFNPFYELAALVPKPFYNSGLLSVCGLYRSVIMDRWKKNLIKIKLSLIIYFGPKPQTMLIALICENSKDAWTGFVPSAVSHIKFRFELFKSWKHFREMKPLKRSSWSKTLTAESNRDEFSWTSVMKKPHSLSVLAAFSPNALKLVNWRLLANFSAA